MAKQGYARQAITTKYLGPTNHRPSRIKATCDAGSLVMEFGGADGKGGVWESHRDAALALAARLDWGQAWIGGSAKGSGYVFVDAGKDY